MTTPIRGGANSVMGYWYVQGIIPNYIENGAHNSLEHYEWTNRENQELRVTYTYHSGSFEAKKSTLLQDGRVVNKETGAEWQVRPRVMGIGLPVWLPFLVIEAVPDSHMVVGYPSRAYLWIMSRKPSFDDELYKQILDRTAELGYDIEQVVRVPQRWGDNHPYTDVGQGSEL